MTRYHRCSALLAAAALAVSLGVTTVQAQTQPDSPMQKNITVSATGTVDATPDIARIQTGVITESETAAQALSGNSQAMAKLIAGLKESAIDAKDIQTSSFRVEPRYTNPRDGQAPEINGYRVVNRGARRRPDITKLGSILDALVKLGANQMNGLSFNVSKAETLKDDASASRRSKRPAPCQAVGLGRRCRSRRRDRHLGRRRPRRPPPLRDWPAPPRPIWSQSKAAPKPLRPRDRHLGVEVRQSTHHPHNVIPGLVPGDPAIRPCGGLKQGGTAPPPPARRADSGMPEQVPGMTAKGLWCVESNGANEYLLGLRPFKPATRFLHSRRAWQHLAARTSQQSCASPRWSAGAAGGRDRLFQTPTAPR